MKNHSEQTIMCSVTFKESQGTKKELLFKKKKK